MDQWCHVNDHVIVFSRVHDVKELVQHIQSHLETEVTSHIKKFDSMAQFEEWKQEEEAASNAYFVTQRAAWINNNVKHIYFYCNRYLYCHLFVLYHILIEFVGLGGLTVVVLINVS